MSRPSSRVMGQFLVAELSPGLVHAIQPDDPLWQAAEGVEAAIFIGRGFFTDRMHYDSEYAPYRSSSEFIAATEGEVVVGAARIIKDNPNGFKTLNDGHEGRLTIDEQGYQVLAAIDHEQDVVIECNIAVDPEHRGSPFDASSVPNRLVSAVVYYVMYYAEQAKQGERYGLISFDSRYFKLIKRLFGGSGPYQALFELGPAQEYLGSPTIPAILNARAMIEWDVHRPGKPILTKLGALATHEY